MLRRAILLAVLLAPVAGRGQSITSSDPGPFTETECASTRPLLSLTWSMASSVTLPVNATYRILASLNDLCAAVTTGTINVVKSGIVATSLTGVTYPGVGNTLSLGDFVDKSGADCASGPTIYVCVQLVESDDTTVRANSGTLALRVQSGPPPVPVIASVQPGESALLVAWTAGTATKAATDRYLVTAAEVTCPVPPDPVTEACLSATIASQGTTTGTSLRLGGLTIGVTYGVRVYAVSEAGIQSAGSAILTGTPIDALDFWELYGGPETGGCGGGPAGLLSLLAVAGLVRTLRRRP